jgi:two-component system OmpR family sensor kinase
VRDNVGDVTKFTSRAWAVASGLTVASIGFLLTRSATAASTTEASATFLLGDLPFLVVGLSLSAFGVGIAVSEWGRIHGTTIVRWCLFGTVATGVAVAVSLSGAGIPMMLADGVTLGLALDLVLTGAVGGTITGVQASRRRESGRELEERNNRLTLLNRILRHEILNGLNVVRGYAGLVGNGPQTGGVDGDRSDAGDAAADGGTGVTDPARAIERSADRINDAADELTRLSRPSGVEPIDLSDVLEACVADARERYPHAEIRLVDDTDGPAVVASRRVEYLFEHLLANAIEHNDAETPQIEVTVACDWNEVAVTIADDGDGLPDRQRRILLDGTLPEYDDPGSGFGLTIVRLLATESNADVDVTSGIDGDGVGIELAFRRHRAPDGIQAGSLDTGVPTGPIKVGAVAAACAAVVMGIPMTTLQGTIPVIGVLYGSPSPVVGWTVHLFHSLVFGLGFVALLSGSRLVRYRSRPVSAAGLGVAYGVGIWVVAAGFVMPIWLRVLGLSAPVPNLTAAGLLGHVLWGATLGGVFAFGRRWLN